MAALATRLSVKTILRTFPVPAATQRPRSATRTSRTCLPCTPVSRATKVRHPPRTESGPARAQRSQRALLFARTNELVKETNFFKCSAPLFTCLPTGNAALKNVRHCGTSLRRHAYNKAMGRMHGLWGETVRAPWSKLLGVIAANSSKLRTGMLCQKN